MSRLVLYDNLVTEHVEPGLAQQRPVRITAERREEHRRAEPVVVDFLAGLPAS